MQIRIQPQIISIEKFKVPDFHSDFITLFKLVTSKLEITINNSNWSVPFQYIFSNELKPIYSQGSDGYLQSKQVDCFYKMRILNQPLFELQYSSDFENLIHLLFNLDINSFKEIESNEFNIISINNLIFEDDKLIIDDYSHYDYELRIYPNTTKNKNAFIANKSHWNIPYVRLANFAFSDEKIEEFTSPNQVCNINIVPAKYRCSFHKTITSENELHSARFSNQEEYYILHKGKYEDCKKLFNNEKALRRLVVSELVKHAKSSQVDDYNERDYFDAMTDGQLGNYDDFIERGGNIDDIDTWSR